MRSESVTRYRWDEMPKEQVSSTLERRLIVLFLLVIACSQPRYESPGDAGAGIDSLNARLVQAYRDRDPRTYAALYTDSAVFEWPAFNTVRGRAGLEAMARSNWASLNDMDLQLTVAARRLASNHATEFGAFRQSWRDSAGVRMTEFGRYVVSLAHQGDGNWRIDRFFGFADSTRPQSTHDR
jgi:ketosteroid isomerase-like protein